jgi:formate dehydrogenase subunit gamma
MMRATHHEPTIVDRYTPGARINHWITAGSLILLALSGLAFFHPSLFFLTGLFGGGASARAIHPWIGVVLLISFAGLFIRFVRFNFWNRDDTLWMRRMGDVINARDERLPELGKYNAGQKLVFWSQTILILILFASGLVLWDQYFFEYTTIEQKRVAVLVHAIAALLAILVWILHVYAAIWVRGTVRAMTRGSVTGGWAWRHHRKWLRQEVSDAERRERRHREA